MKSILNFFLELAKLTFKDYATTALKFSYLGVIGILVGLITYFILLRTVFKPDEEGNGFKHRDISLSVAFLWSMVVVLLLFNIFWFFVIWVNGTGAFMFDKLQFWLSLLPSLSIYLIALFLFYSQYQKVQSILK